MNLIYILDDTEADRELIEMKLRDNADLDIISFYDPKTFTERLSDDVALVITDIRIPNYDVFQSIEYIQQHYPGIYLIVISGYFDDGIYERLFELGVDRVVSKTGLSWMNKVAKYVNDLLPKISQRQKLLHKWTQDG